MSAPLLPRPTVWRRIRQVLRWVWGPSIDVPRRDLVHDEQHRLDAQRAFIKGLVAYIPIIGVLAVTINLLIQVRGNQGVALAIISNLQLSSLALIVTVNVSAYLLPAVVAGLGAVARDVEYDAATRSICTRAAVVCTFISVLVASPLVLLASVVSVIFYGRVDRRRSVRPPTMRSAFPTGVEPRDKDLWSLWAEGRQRHDSTNSNRRRTGPQT